MSVDRTQPGNANANGGRSASTESLAKMAYQELREIAERFLSRERRNHTLQPTALVHEAFLKLADRTHPGIWNGKTHFQAVAATAMRQILVDHARRNATAKRGQGWMRVTLTPEVAYEHGPDVDLIALDDSMNELASLDPRKCRVVEMRFFAGMTCAESAAELGISPKTAEADWYFARAWLHDRLSKAAE